MQSTETNYRDYLHTRPASLVKVFKVPSSTRKREFSLRYLVYYVQFFEGSQPPTDRHRIPPSAQCTLKILVFVFANQRMSDFESDVELLRSMYGDGELEVLEHAGGPIRATIVFRAKPSGAGEEDMRSVCVLRVRVSNRHPDEAPAIDLAMVRGLSDGQVSSLRARLSTVAADAAAAGEAVAFAVFSALQEQLDSAAASGSSECVVCYSALESLADSVSLPRCLHSFHPDCLFGWWNVRVENFRSSPAEVARRDAAASIAAAASKAAAAAQDTADACAARVAAAEQSLRFAQESAAAAARDKAAAAARAEAGGSRSGSGAATSSGGAAKKGGGSKSAGSRGGSGIGGGSSSAAAASEGGPPTLEPLSLADAERSCRHADEQVRIATAAVKAAKADAAAARSRARERAAKAAGDSGVSERTGAASAFPSSASSPSAAGPAASSAADGDRDRDPVSGLPPSVLVCPVCRSALFAPAAAPTAAPGSADRPAAAVSTPSEADRDWFGRDPAAVHAAGLRCYAAYTSWAAANGGDAGDGCAAISSSTAAAGSAAKGGAGTGAGAGAGAGAPSTAAASSASASAADAPGNPGTSSSGSSGTWDHSDPAVVAYVREAQRRHAEIFARQAAAGSLVSDAAF